jgi:hypothetical protein
MSEFKTNKISPRKGTTTTIGDSGDTVTISSGANICNAGTLNVSNLTNSGTITSTGTLTTAGISGGTINNTTGTISGLRGQIEWDTTAKTTAFTAESNKGYFCNTTSASFTVTLPASPSAGDVVGIKDYANTFDTNKCILNANGNKIQGSTELFEITVEGSSIIIIYVDATQGWVITDASKAADISEAPSFINATGGTITECGDYKIHTFTGPGTFCVSQLGNPVGGPSNVDYRVVAGGGAAGSTCVGGAAYYSGGGGAGGHRTTFPSPGCNAGSFPITVQGYPITVGGGGAFVPLGNPGGKGGNSVFSTITSTGGGGGAEGGDGASTGVGQPGGSGGGGSFANPGPPGSAKPAGSGNTPPVSPPQGNNGGAGGGTRGTTVGAGGGGGGAGGVGANSPTPSPGTNGGAGGNGVANSITGSPVTLAGGGGGNGPSAGGAGGSGGGGNGGNTNGGPGSAGTSNTGGGGGGYYAGGSGIVIIRYKFQ